MRTANRPATPYGDFLRAKVDPSNARIFPERPGPYGLIQRAKAILDKTKIICYNIKKGFRRERKPILLAEVLRLRLPLLLYHNFLNLSSLHLKTTNNDQTLVRIIFSLLQEQ